MPFGVSFTPQPRRNGVDPSDRDVEPAVCAHFFTSEPQNEISVDVLTEGQPYVHKTNVLVTLGMCVLDGVPVGYGIGVEWGVALAFCRAIPKESILAGIDEHSTSDDALFVF